MIKKVMIKKVMIKKVMITIKLILFYISGQDPWLMYYFYMFQGHQSILKTKLKSDDQKIDDIFFTLVDTNLDFYMSQSHQSILKTQTQRV